MALTFVSCFVVLLAARVIATPTPTPPICPNAHFVQSAPCETCLSGYYGERCDACPSCVHGTSDCSYYGNGLCSCLTGFTGALKSLYEELSPSIIGFFCIAVLRLKFITKENLSVANLFSDLKEMFISIKESFKTTS